MCGDFNSVMHTDERIGSNVREVEMRDMINCVNYCSMQDIKCSGNFNTSNNKQHGTARIYSKLDRVLSNQGCVDLFSSAKACFQNEGEFDHTPVVIYVYTDDGKGRRPFKYFIMWRMLPQFEECIKRARSIEVQGTKMFKLVKA